MISLTVGNYKLASEQLHKNGQLQNNSVNGANVDYNQTCQYACNLWSLNGYYGSYNEVAMQYTKFNCMNLFYHHCYNSLYHCYALFGNTFRWRFVSCRN